MHRLHARCSGEVDEEYKLFKELNFMIFVVGTLCSTCLFTMYEPFIQLWAGSEYLLGMNVVVFIVLDFYLSIMLQIVTIFRTTNGLFMQGKYRALIMAILNVVLSFLWAKPFGVAGIIAATAVSKVLTEIWYDPWLVYRKVFSQKVSSYYVRSVLYFITTIGTCFLTYFLVNQFSFDSVLLKLIFCLFMSCIVSIALVVVVWGRCNEFRGCWLRMKHIVNGLRRRL